MGVYSIQSESKPRIQGVVACVRVNVEFTCKKQGVRVEIQVLGYCSKGSIRGTMTQ